MKKSGRVLLVIPLLGILIFLAAGVGRVTAAGALQLTPFPTPTPGPDGRIIYIVQPEDTLWRIAAISGLSVEEIQLLNNLGSGEPIVPNQALLLGLGGPVVASPTPGPPPTPTSLNPTPTSLPGSGTICVLLFEDANGDAFHQEAEPGIESGAISISDRSGAVSRTENTIGGALPETICFEELPEGDYNITVAIPEGYNPTTLLSYPIVLNAGDETFLDFGAQISTRALIEAPSPEEGGRSPLLGIIGGGLLVFGLGLGVAASRLRRRSPIKNI